MSPHGCLWHKLEESSTGWAPAHTQEAERRRVNARGCKPERPGPCPAPHHTEHKELRRGGAGQKRGFGSAPTAAL